MMRPSARRGRGSVSVEMAILTPAFLLLVVVGIVYGRVAIAANTIDVAAHDAARAASISRTAGTAQTAAFDAATASLSDQGLNCVDGALVTIDTSGFGQTGLELGYVTVAVTCQVSFTDVQFLPFIPSNATLESSFVSPIDVFRER